MLSIIIPTYNSDKTIRAALESVYMQEYQDYDVLIIDNNSSDNTVEIFKEYSLKYKNIQWYSEKDNGPYDAMNKGIKLAKGEWVYFLGSDDTLLNKNTLSKIFCSELVTNNDVIYGNVISSRFNGRYNFEFDQEKIFATNICHQAVFFKRDIFKRTGFFNLKYKYHSDWDHNMKWILSPNIRSTYFEIDVAEYADGGYSSQTFDEVFAQDKMFNYLKYGISIFSFKKSIKLIFHIILIAIRQRDIKKIFSLKIFVILFLFKKISGKET